MKGSPSLLMTIGFGRFSDKMMKGFSGAAGPRKGADQTVAGLHARYRDGSFCGPPNASEAGRDDPKPDGRMQIPDSGGWQRCRPPFRMRGAGLAGRGPTRRPPEIEPL